MLAVSLAAAVILPIAVALRLLSRWKCRAGYGADDCWITLSLVPTYAMLISGSFMVFQGGLGRHTETLSETEIALLMKTLYTTLITYSTTITAVRISVLLLYRRIFRTKPFKLAVSAVGALTVAWWTAAVLVEIFQCRPVRAAWDMKAKLTGYCINFQAYWYGIAASNLILDCVTLALPLFMVWRLQMTARQKLLLSGVFLLGGLSCVACSMRLATLHTFEKIDLAYTMTTPYIWSQIEPSTAILCACITTYRPLFENLKFKSLLLLSRRRESSYERGSSSSTDQRVRSIGDKELRTLSRGSPVEIDLEKMDQEGIRSSTEKGSAVDRSRILPDSQSPSYEMPPRPL